LTNLKGEYYAASVAAPVLAKIHPKRGILNIEKDDENTDKTKIKMGNKRFLKIYFQEAVEITVMTV
jgi:hypothetical protein